jgi:hypothetical protein
MIEAKYIGLDVHQATISATVLDSTGKLPMEVECPSCGHKATYEPYELTYSRSF